MSETEQGWVPRDGPDLVLQYRDEHQVKGTDRIRLRTASNHVAGVAIGWLFLIVAGGTVMLPLLGNFSEGASTRELLIISVGFCVGSFISYLIFGRPYVDVGNGYLWVRNPLSVNTLSLTSVEALSRSFDGRIRVKSNGGHVTLWGIQQNLRQRLAGHSEEVKVILAEARACGSCPHLSDTVDKNLKYSEQLDRTAQSIAQIRGYEENSVPKARFLGNLKRPKPLDHYLMPLLAGWLAYWLSFIVILLRR